MGSIPWLIGLFIIQVSSQRCNYWQDIFSSCENQIKKYGPWDQTSRINRVRGQHPRWDRNTCKVWADGRCSSKRYSQNLHIGFTRVGLLVCLLYSKDWYLYSNNYLLLLLASLIPIMILGGCFWKIHYTWKLKIFRDFIGCSAKFFLEGRLVMKLCKAASMIQLSLASFPNWINPLEKIWWLESYNLLTNCWTTWLGFVCVYIFLYIAKLVSSNVKLLGQFVF